MNAVEKLFDKLMKIPLNELLTACAMAVEEKMEQKRADVLFIALESRLQKRRLMIKMGWEDETKI